MGEDASDTVENSFAFWQELAGRDAEAAADELIRRIAAVPEDERRAAVAATRAREQLIEEFAAAVKGPTDETGAVEGSTAEGDSGFGAGVAHSSATRALRGSTAQGDSGFGAGVAHSSATRALRGVPYLLKDLFDVRGELTGCSSRVLPAVSGPAAQDGRVKRAMEAAGGVYCGRTQMNEFAYGLDGKNAHFGNCPHPHDPRRASGGSSSGSAWAVGKGIVPLAFGTDTGGSVRVPASLCGIYGFRRGVDEWSADGVFPLAPSLDTVGWFTASAADMASALRVLWEEDESAAAESRPEDPSGSRPGLWCLPRNVPIDPALGEAARRCAEELGAEHDDESEHALDLLLHDCTPAYNIIGSSEAYEVHREWFDGYQHLYDPVVWALIERARHWTAEHRAQAWTLKAAMGLLFEQLLDQYAFVALPAVPVLTPLHEEIDAAYRTNTLQLSVAASLSGLPALTIPLPIDRARSGGLQIVLPAERSSRARSILERSIL